MTKDESSDSYKGEEPRKISDSLTVEFVPVFFHQLRLISKHSIFKYLEDTAA